MKWAFQKRRKQEGGFSLLEMLLATIILLIGLLAIAQLVPATILLNFRNRTDSSALVFAQRELDQFLDQPLYLTTFIDVLGNTCALGNPATPNTILPTNTAVVVINNQAIIDFTQAPVSNYSFLYQDPADPSGTTYDVRWAVIITGNASTVSSKRFILGVRQQGGSGYFQPITLDTTVEK